MALGCRASSTEPSACCSGGLDASGIDNGGSAQTERAQTIEDPPTQPEEKAEEERGVSGSGNGSGAAAMTSQVSSVRSVTSECERISSALARVHRTRTRTRTRQSTCRRQLTTSPLAVATVRHSSNERQHV